MSKKVITTVGTSILTNWDANKQSQYESLEDLVFFAKSEKETNFDLSNEDYNELKNHVFGIIKNEIPNEISAEIKSILAIAEEVGADIEVYLLATDTVLSVLACELIKDWFYQKSEPHEHKTSPEEKDAEGNITKEAQKVNIVIHFKQDDTHICRGLNVVGEGAGDDFKEKGFFSLIDNIEEHKPDILCFSGGYKAIIPIITIMGQLKGIPLYCIYEDDESSLIEFGNLPVGFDWVKAEKYYDFLNLPDKDILSEIQKTEFNNIRKEMIDYKIIEEKESVYKKTALGTILYKFIQETLPTASQVMGFYIELKLLEYYSRKEYKLKGGNKIYCYPSTRTNTRREDEFSELMDYNTNELNQKANREIDLFIFEKLEDRNTNFKTLHGGFVTFECKPLNRFEDALLQSYGQLLNFKKTPKEHCIFLYQENDFKNSYDQNLNRAKSILSTKIQKSERFETVKQAFLQKNVTLRIMYSLVVRNQVTKKNGQENEYMEFMKSLIYVREFDY